MVVAVDGKVACDRGVAAAGRGAYVCPAEECVKRGSRQLARALRSAKLNVKADLLWQAVREAATAATPR
jgi:predicted RNA-binding protein YlxR (DUF448 family)